MIKSRTTPHRLYRPSSQVARKFFRHLVFDYLLRTDPSALDTRVPGPVNSSLALDRLFSGRAPSEKPCQFSDHVSHVLAFHFETALEHVATVLPV